jgi:hypothetical protein
MAEAEPQHRHAPEPEHYRRPVAEAEPQRRPAPQVEPEQHRRPAPEPEYQRRPMAEAEREVYRRPQAAEAEPAPRRPIPVQEPEVDHRPVPPQIYRGAQAAPEEQRRPVARHAQQPQQPPLADFLIRKLSETGAMTVDDLCHLTVQEGYFAEGESADRAVHGTLMNVAKAGFIRQLPNGTFAPATVMDTIRLRRAI